MQFHIQLGQFMNTRSVMYDLHTEGQLIETQWFLVSSNSATFFPTNAGRSFWERLGRINGHPSFAHFVDELLQSGRTLYPLVPNGNGDKQG